MCSSNLTVQGSYIWLDHFQTGCEILHNLKRLIGSRIVDTFCQFLSLCITFYLVISFLSEKNVVNENRWKVLFSRFNTLSSLSWVCLGTSSKCRRCHGQISKDLSYLLSMWRSSGSTLSPSQMTEILTLSLGTARPPFRGSSLLLPVPATLFFWLLPRTNDHRWG